MLLGTAICRFQICYQGNEDNNKDNRDGLTVHKIVEEFATKILDMLGKIMVFISLLYKEMSVWENFVTGNAFQIAG